MIISNKETDTIFKSLSLLGWDFYFQRQLDNIRNSKVSQARVVGVHKNSFLINQGTKETLVIVAEGSVTKKVIYFRLLEDWVLVDDNVIFDVLPRKNVLSRGTAGANGKQDMQPNKEQVIAANLNSVFIVSGLD